MHPQSLLDLILLVALCDLITGIVAGFVVVSWVQSTTQPGTQRNHQRSTADDDDRDHDPADDWKLGKRPYDDEDDDA